MSAGVITLLLFASFVLFLALGLPLAFALGGVAMVFTLLLWGAPALFQVATAAFGTMSGFVLIAIPLFIFMANVLRGSGIADGLYEMMYRWMGPLKGGLSMGTVLICTVFAAMAGISGAATVTMGVLAIPPMLERHYNKNIAVGCVAAGGALGILIPPSIPMIVFATVAGESTGRLFMAGVLPGILLSGLFNIYIGIRCAFQPHLGPPIPPEERASWGEKLASVRELILPLLLILMVLGTIYAGVCTPTEAAGIGAAGSLVCAAIHRRLTWPMLKDAAFLSLRLSSMVLWIVIGAVCFVTVYTATGCPQIVNTLVAELPVGRWVILIGMQLILIILGMFLDPIGIIMIAAPIFMPIIRALGFDPIWFGILFTVNLEMAFLTPPLGFNLFYLKGIVPKDITLADIYRSIVPFVALQALGLAIIMLFPQIALWLPSMMFT